MTSQAFPWLRSLLTKAAILSVGIISIALIGWPVPEHNYDRVRVSSLTQHAPSDVITDIKLSSTANQVDVNRGTAEDFERLPGIGRVLAKRIIDYRQSHGHFKTVAGLKKVSGIGEARMDGLRSVLTITP